MLTRDLQISVPGSIVCVQQLSYSIDGSTDSYAVVSCRVLHGYAALLSADYQTVNLQLCVLIKYLCIKCSTEQACIACWVIL